MISAEPIDSSLSRSQAGFASAELLLIKSSQPKGKGPPQAAGFQIRTGNGTEKSLVKSDSPE
ncbi:hypothetical protein, partial [Streptomyces sp. NPDC055990]|uniref:hypothetical protein n=1 Tax=Streptomyces sp. NPDC055990 TaxID=3345672 RepID=UPI0035D7086D